MQRHRIIELLRTFTKEDIKRFRDFIRSPFFNKSEKLIKLYEVLIAFHPSFNSKSFNEVKILKKVSPNLPFNKSTLRNLMSDLSETAEKYFLHINIESEEIDKNDFLRNELFRRKLDKYIGSNIIKTQSEMSKIIKFDSIYILRYYRLLNDKLNYDWLYPDRSKKSIIDYRATMLAERGKYINYFFIKEIIRSYENLLTLDKTFIVDKDKNFVIKLLKSVDIEKHLRLAISEADNRFIKDVFELYLSLYLAFSRFENEKHYFDYKEKIMSRIRTLSKSEIEFHTIGLLKYCMLKSSEGKAENKFERERFAVYKFILQNELYTSEFSEYVPLQIYRPVILLSLKLKKYKWTMEFIKKYKNKLHPDNKENMYNYSMAEYYFCRGSFEEAMKSFHKVKLDHFMLKLDLKSLMLKTYYELGLFENAYSLIDAYKHFLSNDKTLSVALKKKYNSFIKLVNYMICYKNSKNPDYKSKVLNEFKNVMVSKDWVKEKISELEDDYKKSA